MTRTSPWMTNQLLVDQMGAGLLFFCPKLLTKKHRLDKRKIPIDSVLKRNLRQIGPIGLFLLSGRCFFNYQTMFCLLLVLYELFVLTVYQERKTGITGVPFGRT